MFHYDIRGRFNRGDPEVVDGDAALRRSRRRGPPGTPRPRRERLAGLINANFETRRSIYRLPQWQIDMVETARAAGASAKFAGSGGAIVGTCDGDEMFERVRTSLAAMGCRTIRPQVSE